MLRREEDRNSLRVTMVKRRGNDRRKGKREKMYERGKEKRKITCMRAGPRRDRAVGREEVGLGRREEREKKREKRKENSKKKFLKQQLILHKLGQQ